MQQHHFQIPRVPVFTTPTALPQLQAQRVLVASAESSNWAIVPLKECLPAQLLALFTVLAPTKVPSSRNSSVLVEPSASVQNVDEQILSGTMDMPEDQPVSSNDSPLQPHNIT
jgi:hypothetical protein